MRRPLLLTLATATAAAAAIGLATPALASTGAPAQTLTAAYKVTGSTTIKAINSTLALGPGTLKSTVNLSTGALTATLSLPPATGSFKEFGLIPVTATTQMIQQGLATGKINLTTGAVTTTAHTILQITKLNVGGLPIPVGNRCETSAFPVTVNSQPGFSVVNGGTLAGTYTIPKFSHCLLATLLLNLTIPGPGNTITLTLGPATFG